MPDLSTQIGTLYRVIGQCRPAPGKDGWLDAHLLSHAGVLATECAILPDKWRNVARRFYCLWFSVPLSIWLSSGSIGLLLYWQALSGAACLVERLMGKPKLALEQVRNSSGLLGASKSGTFLMKMPRCSVLSVYIDSEAAVAGFDSGEGDV